MDSRIIFALGFLLMAGLAMAKADEFSEYPEMDSGIQNDEKPAEKTETSNDETTTTAVEDTNSEMSDLVQNDAFKTGKKGFCQWGVAVWYKPGFSIRCSCMKCVCTTVGKWNCNYNFAYCPYYYCGNQIYNPHTQLCCCGKVYAKKSNHSCCGYFYYNTRNSKCCNYFSVKSKRANCPRHKI